MPTTRTLLTLLAAGCLVPAHALAEEDRTPLLSNRTMKSLPVGHIYYNPITGERVVTPFDARPRNSNILLWLNINTDPCATGGTVGIIDDPVIDGELSPCNPGGTFPCEGTWNVWWGDISFDTIVDCIVIAYAIDAPDVDLDSDSIGDGIVGYDLSITFSDNDNGFGADGPGLSARSCILDLTIPTLPGSVGVIPPGFMAVYLLTLDFASTAQSFIFELGDSDGIDCANTGHSGGALYGPANGFPNTSGQDIDGDTLADFSYAMRFDQSTLGTDGTPGASKGNNGFLAVAPKLGNPGDLPPTPADATGLFDAVDIYSTGPSCPPTTSPFLGTFFFGGFTCAPGAEVPHTSAYLELYGGHGEAFCFANFDGSPLPADFTDVLIFLSDFTTDCTPGVGNFDLSSGGTPNDCDFTDVLAFLTNFASPECGN